jgi:hypothetical protein
MPRKIRNKIHNSGLGAAADGHPKCATRFRQANSRQEMHRLHPGGNGKVKAVAVASMVREVKAASSSLNTKEQHCQADTARLYM